VRKISVTSFALKYKYLFIFLKCLLVAVNTGKGKYMEIGRHRGLMANEHITVGSNSNEKVKTVTYLGSLLVESIYLYFPPSSQLLYNIAETTVENKGKLILTEILPSVQKHDILYW
jgi:hypothetical protein